MKELYKKRIILFLFASLLQLISYSNSYYTINGVIRDELTNSPIAYAHISICGSSVGLISNDYGEFSLNIPTKYLNDEICISFIGYETVKLPINKLSDGQFLNVKLKQINYELDEVKIVVKSKKKISPKQIIEKAISNISSNYPQKDFCLNGYYREYLKYKERKYLNLFESAISIAQKGFSKNSFPFNGWIYQKRYNENFEVKKSFQTVYSNIKKNSSLIDENSSVKFVPNIVMPILGGNELSILFAHDPIRRYKERSFSFIDYLDRDFIKNHVFKLDSVVFKGDIPMFCLSFEYKNNRVYNSGAYGDTYAGKAGKWEKQHDVRGNIRILCNSYKIEHLTYTNYSTEETDRKLYEIIVNYKEFNSLMYLNYLSFSNFFKITIPPEDANLFIPYEKIPPRLKNVFINNNKMILQFDKDINKSSAGRAKKYSFKGAINIEVNDSMRVVDLIETPDFVDVINKRIIEISFPYSHFLKENDFLKIIDNRIYFKTFTLTITNLTDQYGNQFGKSTALPFFQFREFYVNKVDSISQPQYSQNIKLDILKPLYDHHIEESDHFWDLYNYPSTKRLMNRNLDKSLK